MSSNEKVFCEDPDGELTGPRIDRWKYDMIAAAILDALPPRGGGLSFTQLEEEVRLRVRADRVARLGSLPWYVRTVGLDLVAKHEVQRVLGSQQSKLIRARSLRSMASPPRGAMLF